MTAPPQKRRLGAEQRRALQLIASIPFGVDESTMLANGVTRRVLAELVQAGLATVERSAAGTDSPRRVRITAAGRTALKG